MTEQKFALTYATDQYIGRINLVNIQADLALFGKDYPSSGLEAGFLRQKIEEKGVLIALDDGTLAGFVVFEEMHRPDYYHVCQISTAPDYQRRGLGTQLMKHMIEEVRVRGCAAIGLTTTMTAPWSVNFYQKLGFVQKGFDELDHGISEKISGEMVYQPETKGYFELVFDGRQNK